MTTNSPPPKRQRRENVESPITKLTTDEWFLIFDILRDEDPWFLSRLSLVSKTFQALTAPLLYRSVTFPRRLDDLTSKPFGLLGRLLDDSNMHLRAYVQELTVPQIAASYQGERRHDFEDSGYLEQVVRSLPNLRRLRVMHPLPFLDSFIDSLDDHPNKPELQLLAVNGWEKAPTRYFNAVSTIKASLLREPQRVQAETDDFPSMMVNFQKLFFSCPNLKHYSLTMFGPFEDPDRLETFEMTGQEKFPPIESLSFNGYCIPPNEWPHWRDRFPWFSLSSLEVGPQTDCTERLLHSLIGYTNSLKSFKITVFTGEDEARAQSALETFLRSFNSLETLEIINYVCPIEAIANHSELTHLTVHLGEDWDADDAIQLWRSTDLDYLDESCPNLHVLNIDLERYPIEFDNDVLMSIAKGFDSLREISFHIRIGGVRGISQSLSPVLSYENARPIARPLFLARKHSFDYLRSRPPNKKTDKLEKVILKSGVEMHLLNGFDGDRTLEELNKKTFELRRPKCESDELILIHHEKDRIEAQNKQGYPGATDEKVRNIVYAAEAGVLRDYQWEAMCKSK